jgi:hypothetical protein
MDTTFLQWLTSLGVGGVLAAGMFFVYRKDVQVMREQNLQFAERALTLADKLIDATARIEGQLAATSTLIMRLLQRMDVQEGKKADGAQR